MSLQHLYAQLEQDELIDLPDGWKQGRTIYGGLVAGLLVAKAIKSLDDQNKQLLNANITFVGPVTYAPILVKAKVLRAGKFVTTVEVKLWQNDEVLSILVASFGLSRESQMQIDQLPIVPEYPNPDQLNTLPYYEGLTPEFYKQFEMCWAEGLYPYVGKNKIDFGGWFRFNPNSHKDRAMSIADFIVMLDIWPAGVYPMLTGPVPTSTLTWNITFLAPINSDIHGWLKYKMHTDFASDGYLRETEYIWNTENKLIAISKQTLTIFT